MTQRLPPETRRRQLLDAALELVDESGFEDLSVEAVARRAGVTRPMVYDQFGDLGGLLDALADREESRALAALADVVPAEPPEGQAPDDVLVQRLGALLEAVRAQPATWRLVLHPPDGSPEHLRERIEANRARIRVELEALLAWGVAERGGPEGIDVELLAHLLVHVAENAARLVLADPDGHPPQRLQRFARALLEAVPGEAAR